MQELTKSPDEKEGRVARRRRRNFTALVEAAREIMTEKGVDAATMLEIAERADVGAGTVYNYFRSKDELAVAVLEDLMQELSQEIEDATQGFREPERIYAYGLQRVLETAATDERWAPMLHRSEIISDALYRKMGPYAMRDLKAAADNGMSAFSDVELVFRLTTHALIGASLAIRNGELAESSLKQIVIELLCLTGIGMAEAKALVRRSQPSPSRKHKRRSEKS